MNYFCVLHAHTPRLSLRYLGLCIVTSLILAFSAANCSAQNVGLGLFALQSPTFPCESALRAFSSSESPTLAILWGTFGGDNRCLERWLRDARNRPHLLEVHLSNEACRRNKRCSESDFLPSLSVAQLNARLEQKDARILQSYAMKVREIRNTLAPFMTERGEYLISTGLEDNFSDAAYGMVLETVRANWPHKVVRSPVGDPRRRDRAGADYLEGHGATPQFNGETPCIVNLDGDDMHFPHRSATLRNNRSWEEVLKFVETFSKKCRATFLWAAPWQGVSDATFSRPLDRRFVLSNEDVEAVKKLLP